TGENPLARLPAERPPSALDAFYITRLQRERLAIKDDSPASYVHIDARALRSSRAQEAVVMHPLPRTDELAYELDDDPRAVYFEQAAAGVPVRMALLAWMLENASHPHPALAATPRLTFPRELVPVCANARCITRRESSYLIPRFRPARSADPSAYLLRCEYCERELRVEYLGH